MEIDKLKDAAERARQLLKEGRKWAAAHELQVLLFDDDYIDKLYDEDMREEYKEMIHRPWSIVDQTGYTRVQVSGHDKALDRLSDMRINYPAESFTLTNTRDWNE